jgi:hypothetical protein
MLDRSLDGELVAGPRVQTLVSEVVSALPELVRSYTNETGPDVGRIRKLTNACFSVAASGETDQQGSSPGITGVISATGAMADSLAATNNLTH